MEKQLQKPFGKERVKLSAMDRSKMPTVLHAGFWKDPLGTTGFTPHWWYRDTQTTKVLIAVNSQAFTA